MVVGTRKAPQRTLNHSSTKCNWLLQVLSQRLDQGGHFRVLKKLNQHLGIGTVGDWTLFLFFPAGVKRFLKQLSVLHAVVIEDMGIQIRDHLRLGVTGITLYGFDVSAVQFKLICDTGMAQAVKYHLREIVLFDQPAERVVDAGRFYGHSERPGNNKPKVFISTVLIIGIGGLELTIGAVTLTEIATALILGIIANIILSGKKQKEI